MEEVFTKLYELLMGIIESSSIYGPLFACFLIMIESILPILPLFVFITIVFIAYGYVIGFIISYILTVIGCSLAFFLCRYIFKDLFKKKVRKNPSFDKIMKKVDKIKLSTLVTLIVIPFTPAFMINIACALSDMKYKKFLVAALIGKPFLVFFWGFIGTSLLESLKNPKILVVILIMLLLSYIISKILMKKMSLED